MPAAVAVGAALQLDRELSVVAAVQECGVVAEVCGTRKHDSRCSGDVCQTSAMQVGYEMRHAAPCRHCGIALSGPALRSLRSLTSSEQQQYRGRRRRLTRH